MTAAPRPPDHREFNLARGEYLYLRVEQAAVDRNVTLFGPDDERLLFVDSLGGAVEEVHWVARTAGLHRVEVDPGAGPKGGATTLVARRPANSGDIAQAAAEAALAQAHGLRRADDLASNRAAVPAYRHSENLFAGLGLPARRAEALFGLGMLLRSPLGELTAARQAFEQAASLAPDDHTRADALLQAAVLALETGDDEGAAALYEAALVLRRAAADREGEARTANNLGNLYHRHLGRYGDAARLLERSAALWQRLGNASEEANTLANLGRLELEIDQTLPARGHLERAIELAEQAEQHEVAAGAHRALGGLLLDLGEPQEALGQLTTALRLRPDADRPRAMTLTTLGVAYRHLGNSSAARAAYREALTIFRREGDSREEALTLHNLGYLALLDGDGKAAMELLDQALHLFDAAADPTGEARTQLVRAQALRGSGDLQEARRAALLALGEIEHWRSRSWRLAARAAFFASHQDFYDFLIDLLMEMDARSPAAGWDAEALQIAERARARSLLDALAAGGDDPRGGSGSRLLEEEWELERGITATRERWKHLRTDEAATRDRLRAVDEELDDTLEPLQRRLDEVRAAIRVESPRWAALTQPQPLSARQIQALLDEQTLLLEYRLGPRSSTLWAVTRDSLESFRLPGGRAEIEAAVRQVHRLLSGSYSQKRAIPAQQQLDQLSTLLLTPVAEQLAGRRLVVVADGPLQYIPFAALPIPRVPSAPRQPSAEDQPPLVTEHELVSLPSASALAQLRRRLERRPPAPRWLWVLADPEFGGRFTPLPHTRDEARALVSLIPPTQSQLVTGAQANRRAVVEGGLDRFRILHFATHGIFEAGAAGGSRLILAQVDAEGLPVDDGLLHLPDVYHLDLAADLVVLSACETALGEEIRGEGLVGMTQGFFHAGAERVVVSLWNVPDRVTAALMEHFYRGILRHHLAPAAALRQAQQTIRRQERWSLPYYWAGFLLQGEWRDLPGPSAAEPE